MSRRKNHNWNSDIRIEKQYNHTIKRSAKRLSDTVYIVSRSRLANPTQNPELNLICQFPVPASHFDPAAAPGRQRLDAAAPEEHPPPPASGPAVQEGGFEASFPSAQTDSISPNGHILYSFGV